MNKSIICFILLLISQYTILSAQESAGNPQENIRARGAVTGEKEIKLRWAPANTKAWADGRKYGYTVERYTLIVDSAWQENPIKLIIADNLKPQPLDKWEGQAIKSDYAAVMAQAFYGEDFELSASGKNDIGSIINQANELEQRFSTSVFMAEYDYQAALLAGWAWTDNSVKENERYLYRIYLNRPQRLQGDTAAVYIGLEDKRELPKPIGLNTLFGDKSVMLSWNYVLLADTYHSYHVERKSESEPFRRITELPVTALGENMTEIFYTDSLANNQTVYTYRIVGLTGFDQTGIYSDEVNGHGEKVNSCIPHIYNGDFTSENRAKIYWEFECDDSSLINKFSLSGSQNIAGEYLPLADNLPVASRELEFALSTKMYVKLIAESKNGSKTESFPFLLRPIDSIPPATPMGLMVKVDSVGIAHLSWNANLEKDFRGYRILRSFTEEGEKSSITPTFISQNQYTDTLSLNLGNPYVYYSLTAIDERYNESQPCPTVKAAKPNKSTPDEPVITRYELSGNNVTIEWATNSKYPDVIYSLLRTNLDNTAGSVKIVFAGDYMINSYTDQALKPGNYCYSLMAQGANGKKSYSPQSQDVNITADAAPSEISGLTSYVDVNKGYIELSWKKQDKAEIYRIYKAVKGQKISLWKELDATQNRIVDEIVSAGNEYSYTILYLNKEGRASKSKTIVVNY